MTKTPAVTMHEGQLYVDQTTARGLVDEQFPQWRDLSLTPVTSDGTVNQLFRLGDQVTLRFPLQGDDPTSVRAFLEAEAAASSELADAVSIAAPRPLGIGTPGRGYPLPWAAQTWVGGEVATRADVADSEVFASGLATLIWELREVPVAGRLFSGRGRGGKITAHDDWMETCLRNSEGLLDVPVLRGLWKRFRALPDVDHLAMTHGDLMPGNLLIDGERLVGVIDCGGFAPTDPALELVGCWHLLNTTARNQVRAELGSSDLEWTRGQAWAFVQSMGLVWYYQTSNPVMARIGRTTLARIVDDPTV